MLCCEGESSTLVESAGAGAEISHFSAAPDRLCGYDLGKLLTLFEHQFPDLYNGMHYLGGVIVN